VIQTVTTSQNLENGKLSFQEMSFPSGLLSYFLFTNWLCAFFCSRF